MRAYEVMYIIRPDMEQEDCDSVIKRFSEQIEKDGGKIGQMDVWGKRRLAYPIKHFEEGYYILCDFEGDNRTIDELTRTMTMADDIIRFKILRKEAS